MNRLEIRHQERAGTWEVLYWGGVIRTFYEEQDARNYVRRLQAAGPLAAMALTTARA